MVEAGRRRRVRRSAARRRRRRARLSPWTTCASACASCPAAGGCSTPPPATDGVHLVGGAVRDLLLGRAPRELDVVVEGDVGALAARLGAGATRVAHERFGTATVRDGDCRWDLAAARAETYARPGALPDVRAGRDRAGPAPPRRDGQRARAGPRHRRAARRAARRRRISPPGGCASCTTRASSTTRRACGASRATRRGWASTLEEHTARLAARGGRARGALGDGVRRADRQRAAPRARRARPGRRARGRPSRSASRRGWRPTAR